MKIILSILLSSLLFLSGFSKGPALHYCYSSGNVRADISRVLSGDHDDAHSACSQAATEACCAVKKAEKERSEAGGCCDDFEFKVELKEYSFSQWANPVPVPAMLQLFIIPFFSVFAAPQYIATESLPYSYADPGILWSEKIPLFIEYAVFRI